MCKKEAADIIFFFFVSSGSSMNILLLVPRIVLIAQYLKRLLNYAIPKENIGVGTSENVKK